MAVQDQSREEMMTYVDNWTNLLSLYTVDTPIIPPTTIAKIAIKSKD